MAKTMKQRARLGERTRNKDGTLFRGGWRNLWKGRKKKAKTKSKKRG